LISAGYLSTNFINSYKNAFENRYYVYEYYSKNGNNLFLSISKRYDVSKYMGFEFGIGYYGMSAYEKVTRYYFDKIELHYVGFSNSIVFKAPYKYLTLVAKISSRFDFLVREKLGHEDYIKIGKIDLFKLTPIFSIGTELNLFDNWNPYIELLSMRDWGDIQYTRQDIANSTTIKGQAVGLLFGVRF
jgi:hypothetical protein